MTQPKKKPLLCRLGLHSWFLDSSYFYSVKCCKHCFEYQDPEKGLLIRKERELFAETRELALNRGDALIHVMKNLKVESQSNG